jgi:hypothetical protein
MKFEQVDKLIKKQDERAKHAMIVSLVKAIIIVGICFAFDFNKYFISLLAVWHLMAFYIHFEDIKMIRELLAAFYGDLKNIE